MDYAAERLNAGEFTAFAAPDIVFIDDEGKTHNGIAELKQYMAGEFGAMKRMIHCKSALHQVKTGGDAVRVDLVVQASVEAEDSEGKYGKKGLLHHFEVKMDWEHEWKKVGGKWLLARFVMAGYTGTMDGKPMPRQE
jgi:ketosteroid isomerase-like protein